MRKIYDNKGTLFAELNYSEEYFQSYSRHSHNSISIAVFSSGEVEVEFHNKEDVLVSNKQVIIFNPNQVHQTKSELKKTKDYFTLHVDTSWCKNIQREFFALKEEFIYLQNIIDDDSLAKSLLDIFYEIKNSNEKKSSKLEAILIKILKEYTLLDLKKSESKEYQVCKKIEEYILQNLEEQITLEDIAKYVAYNESYISRIFKKEYGLSPHAFLINKRVQKAKDSLLNNNRIDLAKLSNKFGFYDQSHFSKVFKKTFATTPNQYKKSK